MSKEFQTSSTPNGMAKHAALYTWLLANTPIAGCLLLALSRNGPVAVDQYQNIGAGITLFGVALLIRTLKSILAQNNILAVSLDRMVPINLLKPLIKQATLATLCLVLILVGTLNHRHLYIFAIGFISYAALWLKVLITLRSFKS